MCGRLPVGKEFLNVYAELVGAAMCQGRRRPQDAGSRRAAADGVARAGTWRVVCNDRQICHGLHKQLRDTGPIDVEPSGGNVTRRVAGYLAVIKFDAMNRQAVVAPVQRDQKPARAPFSLRRQEALSSSVKLLTQERMS